MSHLTYITTTIKNTQVLETVLNQMITDGLNGILSKAKLERNVTEHSFDNNGTVDFVLRRTNRTFYQDCPDFGFRKDSSGEFKFLNYYGAYQDAGKFIEKLTPWYARENAIASLISQGFNVDSITEENGEVRIIAGKWS